MSRADGARPAPRFDRTTGAVLVIDIQERLFAAMPEERRERLLNRTTALLVGAQSLGLPVLVTEQYPKGLGPTVEPLRPLLERASRFEKTEFSAAIPPVLAALGERKRVAVVGMETHVCVFQTVRALVASGYEPFVCTDAVMSRTEEDRAAGLELARASGAILTSVEACLFDALERAGTPEFKAVSAAVK